MWAVSVKSTLPLRRKSKIRMDTSAIIYRVADFLKAHPPFNAMDEPDLLEFASRGRVRFHEAHDYVLWQGEPNQFKVFVIQQARCRSGTSGASAPNCAMSAAPAT